MASTQQNRRGNAVPENGSIQAANGIGGLARYSETGQPDSVPSGALDPVAAFALLVAELSGEEETPEPGYFTAEQWAAKVGKSQSQTGALLRKFVNAGRAERRKYRIKTGDKTYPVPHYRLNR